MQTNRIIYTPSHVPMLLQCYVCSNNGVTRVEMINGGAAWGTCLACCFFLGPFSCFGSCAFCIDSIKDVQHYCAHCNSLIAVRKPCM